MFWGLRFCEVNRIDINKCVVIIELEMRYLIKKGGICEFLWNFFNFEE